MTTRRNKADRRPVRRADAGLAAFFGEETVAEAVGPEWCNGPHAILGTKMNSPLHLTM